MITLFFWGHEDEQPKILGRVELEKTRVRIQGEAAKRAWESVKSGKPKTLVELKKALLALTSRNNEYAWVDFIESPFRVRPYDPDDPTHDPLPLYQIVVDQADDRTRQVSSKLSPVALDAEEPADENPHDYVVQVEVAKR